MKIFSSRKQKQKQNRELSQDQPWTRIWHEYIHNSSKEWTFSKYPEVIWIIFGTAFLLVPLIPSRILIENNVNHENKLSVNPNHMSLSTVDFYCCRLVVYRLSPRTDGNGLFRSHSRKVFSTECENESSMSAVYVKLNSKKALSQNKGITTIWCWFRWSKIKRRDFKNLFITHFYVFALRYSGVYFCTFAANYWRRNANNKLISSRLKYLLFVCFVNAQTLGMKVKS